MAGEASSDRDFAFEAPRPVGRLRSFTRRSRYRPVSGLKSSKDQLGSNSSLSSLSGGSVFGLYYYLKLFVYFCDVHICQSVHITVLCTIPQLFQFI